ncbi:MAG: hypothetical protein HY044_02145 [Candidatus Woesebacteria bacterium]|nr:MAG: hypothetical protein HY044_02145 [Candidatus Woesebacteria bacterium]
MTIKQARKLLGKVSKGLTDSEVEQVIQKISFLADFVLEKVEDSQILSKMKEQNEHTQRA